jgi:DNA-directed RNA polymerase subunit RPC12/RpoP
MTCVAVETISIVTCPVCGHKEAEEMPPDACQFLYDCRGCGSELKALSGNRCVFCSYGTVPCPPIQTERAARETP